MSDHERDELLARLERVSRLNVSLPVARTRADVLERVGRVVTDLEAAGMWVTWSVDGPDDGPLNVSITARPRVVD